MSISCKIGYKCSVAKWNVVFKNPLKLYLVAGVFNPSTNEAEAAGYLQVWGQPGLHSGTLSQNKNPENNDNKEKEEGEKTYTTTPGAWQTDISYHFKGFFFLNYLF